MFKDMGVDRVYPTDVQLPKVIEDLVADCKGRRLRENKKQKNER